MSKHTFNRSKPHLVKSPPPPPPPPPSGLTINTTGGVVTTAQFAVDSGDEAGSYYAIYATLGMGAGTMSPPNSAFRLIASIENNGLLSVLSFVSEYVAAFPFGEAGSKIFVRLAYINSLAGINQKMGQWVTIVTGT